VKGKRRIQSSILALVVAAAPTSAFAENVNLTRCKAADADFDYEKVITTCALAATDPGNTREERIVINRLLAIAHTALNDEKSAEVWFIRLLVLDPNHAFGPELSPVYHEALARAKKTFEKRGRIVVESLPAGTGSSAGAMKLEFHVTDQLGQIEAGRVRVHAVQGARSGPVLEVPLSREQTSGAGKVRFVGDIPYPPPLVADGTKYFAEYELVLLNAGGDPLAATPPFVPQRVELTSEGATTVGQPAEAESMGVMPWVIGGVGLGALVITGGLGAATAALCIMEPRACTPQPPQGPAGYVRVAPSVEQ